MNTQRISLDLSKRTGNQQIVIAQGDASGTTIVATIYDNGTKLAETGVTAQFLIELPDGKHYVRDNATYNAGVITYVCDESKVASVHGYTDNAYFTLTKGNTIVSTERFAVIVKPCAYDGMEVAESYDSAIQDAIDALDAAVEQMPDMVEDVLADHPEWTTTVQDGSITKDKLATDLARDRERLLYRLANMLTNALPEGDVATATDAAKTPVAGLALYGRSTQDGTPTPSAPVPIVSVEGDSEGNISLLARGFNQWDEDVEAGGINTGTGQNTATAGYNRSKSYISVFPSTEYYIKAPTTMALLFYDADGAFIAGSATYRANTTFTTPANARYMRFRNDTADAWPTYNHDICINLSGPRNGEFVPYTGTTTPIDLDGHALRSLPDGTRDEVTVGADGHAVLVQRVGSVTYDGSSDESWNAYAYNHGTGFYISTALFANPSTNQQRLKWVMCDSFETVTSNTTMTAGTFYLGGGTAVRSLNFLHGSVTTLDAWRAWLAENPVTVIGLLATPVTIDLGYVDAVPLCGPDLTAQAVPTAPFALEYERDLNTTLARLESAIATLA